MTSASIASSADILNFPFTNTEPFPVAAVEKNLSSQAKEMRELNREETAVFVYN